MFILSVSLFAIVSALMLSSLFQGICFGIPNRYFEPHRPPISNPGTNQTVSAGQFVTLDGSKSKAPDGTITSYLWKQIGGPNVILNGANMSIATFTAPKDISSNTDMIFELKVTDNKNASNTADVKLTDKYVPPPPPPISNPGTNQTVSAGQHNVTTQVKCFDMAGEGMTVVHVCTPLNVGLTNHTGTAH
jgi:chitinase